jgi:hypothetical protein
MPRRSRDLVQAASRAAEARRVVAGQRLLVETLKKSGKLSRDAKDRLQTYVSALEVLEGHERRLLEDRKAKVRPPVNASDYSYCTQTTGISAPDGRRRPPLNPSIC